MEKELIVEVSEKNRDYTRSISEADLSATIALHKNGATLEVVLREFLAVSKLVVAEGNGDVDFSLVLNGTDEALSWDELAEAFVS